MTIDSSSNPYAGNILTDSLGPILSPKDGLKALMNRPVPPSSLAGVPPHVRMHMLMEVRDLHIPSLIERQLLQTTDLMIRQGYKYRDPRETRHWGALSGEVPHRAAIPQASAASVEGLSGVGKTQGCLRCLSTFPQAVQHAKFPRLVGSHIQVVWLSVEVPPSGKAGDFARALMHAWRQATGSPRFDIWLAKEKFTDPMRALAEWLQVARLHTLGLLHLDEIQNLFKFLSLKQRKVRKGIADTPELSIVEDQLLRWILELTNSGGIPLLASGTPDGMGALTKRLSTLQRMNTFGYHPFEPVSLTSGSKLEDSFLGQLSAYQYVRCRIAMDEKLATLIINLSGGIHRVIIALWVAAHRVAFERRSDDLRIEDFTAAAATYLAPMAPAIAALRTQDPAKMAKYEDLVGRDQSFWSTFWHNNSAA